MIDPVVTYRIQFHKDFTFRHLEEAIPYLDALGVRALYASPIFESAPGSTHGYDGVNPHRINPEIGTEHELRKISRMLKERGIAWIQDIVPNHMAFHPNNLWLMDVLEKGRYSVFANFFDLAWAGDLFHGRIIVPVLGAPTEDVLFNKEIQIAYAQQRFALTLYDNHYPLHPRSYRFILDSDTAPDAIRVVTEQIAALHQEENPVAYSLRWHELLLQLDSLLQNAAVSDYINACVERINRDGIALRRILDEQTYTLTPWQVTDKRITFRRFFTVNELIGLNIEDEKVFDHYHRYVKMLVDDGIFQGLRIDHIDGLFEPQQYTERLRALVGHEVPIYVEKILKFTENLPSWPVQGATGYEFMAWVNQLMTYAPSAVHVKNIYKNVLSTELSLPEEVYNKKAYILHTHMRGELDNLYHLFLELNLVDKSLLTQEVLKSLKIAIGEFLIQCPVYRYYATAFPLPPHEEKAVRAMLADVVKRTPSLADAAAVLKKALVQPNPADAAHAVRAAKFYKRCMQFTGPLMAKGFEDTLFYTYNLFIGHNEVGDSPEMFGMDAHQFHTRMVHRRKHWPLSLNATSTHDTKRGEDARARLNVITEIPDHWEEALAEWTPLAEPFKTSGMPDANDTYFIFQTLVGTYPLSHEQAYPGRLQEYIVKALRESKRNSDWAAPNEAYEQATLTFISSLLMEGSPFEKSFKKFLKAITDGGLLNSLSQVILKFSCPGVPDIYQGCEGLDYSLVDPDNRQLIDYDRHMASLLEFASLDEGKELSTLWKKKHDGRIKQWIVSVLSKVRGNASSLFTEGEYIPLVVTGKHSDHVLAFARRHDDRWVVVAIPLYSTRLALNQQAKILDIHWDDTAVELPPNAPASWTNVLTSSTGEQHGRLLVSAIFRDFPLAVLTLQKQPNPRAAGIILHITSLPTAFAIGDMGPAAYAFADFLQRSGQTWWQLLPLNPTSAQNAHSPYSAFSSMAGNTLLISPELLLEEDLIDPGLLRSYRQEPTHTVDFATAQRQKEELLQRAWIAFQKRNDARWRAALEEFIEQENYWLHDFALYAVLKAFHKQLPWNEWPALYRKRDPVAMRKFSDRHALELLEVKWQQFVFHTQWRKLKTYCNQRGVKLFGDLPFYVVYDSADVWSHPDNFSLDANGSIKYMAGVPPDYFNDQGQLWGMPVFNWQYLRDNNYLWWKQRLQKNKEMVDIIRLDHFRAFADFWQVAAGETSAVAGKWEKGPGEDFFNAVRDTLGTLPFVAEDLGEITPDVFTLRDTFGFPGMKVLQFAFGDNMPGSLYIPHNFENQNFVAYTGTHDNNTTLGWFREDIDAGTRAVLSAYSGCTVNEEHVTEVLMRMAYASVARLAIVPMQDILGLDETGRMNTPGSERGNWLWRMKELPDAKVEEKLREWVGMYNRGA